MCRAPPKSTPEYNIGAGRRGWGVGGQSALEEKKMLIDPGSTRQILKHYLLMGSGGPQLSVTSVLSCKKLLVNYTLI